MNFLQKESPLDKYIEDVKTYLPGKNRQDIIDELRSILEDRLTDMSAESNQAPSDEAVIEMLSDFGHPLRVAAKYQSDSRSLVGPTLYPFYRMSVMVSLIVSTCILVILLAVKSLFDIDLGDVNRVWMFVNTYIYIVGIITAGFFMAERLMERSHYLDSWQPNAMDQPDNALTSAWAAIIAVIAATTCLVILNMIGIEHSLEVLFGQADNPVHTLVFWMKIQLVILIPQYFFLIFNQTWSRNRLLLRATTELIVAIGCLVVLFTNVENLPLSYNDFPQILVAVFNYTVWGLLLAACISSAIYWRKLAVTGNAE